MRRVPSRLLCATTVLLLLALTAGGGGAVDPVGVGVIEMKYSFTNPASAKMVDSGIRQLTSELAVDAELTKCDTEGLSEEVESLAEARGRILHPGHRPGQPGRSIRREANPDIPLAALGMSLEGSPRHTPLTPTGITCVRYKVEEGAYLSGVLAASLTVTRGHPWINPEAVVGFIGCPEDPFEAAYVKGFEAGVASINPNCAVAEYEIPNAGDLVTTRAIVEEAVKLKADIFFCVPGEFSREVLALGGARGFLAITSDADGTASAPDSLLASTVLRDDLAMFQATQLFLKEDLPSGLVEWGVGEGIVDFSVNMKQYIYVPAAVDQSLKLPVPRNI